MLISTIVTMLKCFLGVNGIVNLFHKDNSEPSFRKLEEADLSQKTKSLVG
jgi:hypothetical protein